MRSLAAQPLALRTWRPSFLPFGLMHAASVVLTLPIQWRADHFSLLVGIFPFRCEHLLNGRRIGKYRLFFDASTLLYDHASQKSFDAGSSLLHKVPLNLPPVPALLVVMGLLETLSETLRWLNLEQRRPAPSSPPQRLWEKQCNALSAPCC